MKKESSRVQKSYICLHKNKRRRDFDIELQGFIKQPRQVRFWLSKAEEEAREDASVSETRRARLTIAPVAVSLLFLSIYDLSLSFPLCAGNFHKLLRLQYNSSVEQRRETVGKLERNCAEEE